MNITILVAAISALAAIAVAAITYWTSKNREREAEWRKEKLSHYKEYTPSNIPITVIGHSLGGAIALHISLREQYVNTFVFNTSTRFTRGNATDNERHSYSEYAEANKILRVFTIDPKWIHSIYSCTFGNPIKNHAQVKLAACLTACASQINEKAKQSVMNNPKIFEGNNISERACI